MSHLSTPLTPKNRRKLLVLFTCRISTVHQDIRSFADQKALCREWLTQHTDLDPEIVVIAGRGSGEDLEREDYLKACDEVAWDRYYLVLVEDLGRICRRIHALLFCEQCEDHGTRLVAINDGIDTETDGWRMSSFFAAVMHEISNADTSKRIRRTLRDRFQQGGVSLEEFSVGAIGADRGVVGSAGSRTGGRVAAGDSRA